MRGYERKLAAWQSRRDVYEAKHGISPETWQQLNTEAVESHSKATGLRETLEHNLASRSEQSLRVDHAHFAAEITAARQSLDQAGLFGKNAARRALAEVETRYENTFGIQPDANVLPEPPLQLVQDVRAQALTGDDPDLNRARALEEETAVKASALKDTAPQWCTERDRPKPPTAGTPEQESTKDRVFAGRAARAKQTKVSGPTSTPTPEHSNGPEH